MASLPWHFERYDDRQHERSNNAKEGLLRQSLALVRGRKGNGYAVGRIIEKSLEAGLIGFAKKAFHALSADADVDESIYSAIERFFEAPGYWRHADADFVAYCEGRTLAGEPCGSGLVWGDHEGNARSVSLAHLGRFRFFGGDGARAAELWSAAGDRADVDNVIAGMSELIASNEQGRLPQALELVNFIRTPRIRATALADLSSYI